jgi:hypothetical protein
MANGDNSWTIDTVPQVFWDRIEGSGGDVRKFKESLANLSEEEMREMVAQYDGLSETLVTNGFDRFPADLREELTETLEEIADWVITQGRASYEDVLANPEKFPRRNQIRRPIFAGAIIEEYTRRFGPWRE